MKDALPWFMTFGGLLFLVYQIGWAMGYRKARSIWKPTDGPYGK